MCGLPMNRFLSALVTSLAALALAGCATRAVDVKPLPANPADFALWGCDRLHDEQDRVQQRATEVAYAVDERSGKNIMALGLGLTVFWPALLAMRPVGLEGDELARLKGRYEALMQAAQGKACAPASTALPAAVVAQLPVAVGEKLVYELRTNAKTAGSQQVLQLLALRRTEFVFQVEVPADAPAPGPWLQDRAGNVVQAPDGALTWPNLLRSGLDLGQVLAGDLQLVGDPLTRARMRGQVVAVGPQSIAGRRFDVAVIELFGDAPRGEAYTRVEGALVVDRTSGVLLRLDLRSANPVFQLQRRLMRVEPGADRVPVSQTAPGRAPISGTPTGQSSVPTQSPR